MENRNLIPKGFFSTVKNIITTKEALKNVTPMNWDEVLKEKKLKKKMKKLVKQKKFN